jgi:hypothetical protein
MNFFIKIKHWQLFLLIIAISIIAQVFFTSYFDKNQNNKSLIFFPFIGQILILYLWHLSIGLMLHKKLLPNIKMSIVKFEIALFISFVSFFFISYILFTILSLPMTQNMLPYILSLFLSLPVLIVSIFYCLYFNAKALKSIELQKNANFNEYILEFFLLCFFAIGVWIIQPKINQIFFAKNDKQ